MKKKQRKKWPELTSEQLILIRQLRVQGMSRKKVAAKIGCAEHQIRFLEWKEQGPVSVTQKQEIKTPVQPRKHGGYRRYTPEQHKEWAETLVVMRLDDTLSSMDQLAAKAEIPKSQWKAVFSIAEELYKKELKAAVVEKEYAKVEVPTEVNLADSISTINTDTLVLELLHRAANLMQQLQVPLAPSFKAALKPLPEKTVKIKESKETRKRVLLVGFLDGQAKMLQDEYPDLELRFANQTQSVPNVNVGWVVVMRFVSHATWNRASKDDRKVYFVNGLSEARRRLSEIQSWSSQP